MSMGFPQPLGKCSNPHYPQAGSQPHIFGEYKQVSRYGSALYGGKGIQQVRGYERLCTWATMQALQYICKKLKQTISRGPSALQSMIKGVKIGKQEQ